MWYQKQIHFNYVQCVLDEYSINTGAYLLNATAGVKYTQQNRKLYFDIHIKIH